MSDGERLAVTLYLPESGVRPCILEALPYRKDDLTASFLDGVRWLGHTVGTPAENVTCSSSMSACNVSASPSFGPGNTSLAPTIALEYGKPQAFT